MKTIAWRYWNKNNPVFYVANKIGKVGDWGYTTDAKKAIHLSPYWQRRFAHDCREVGEHPHFLTVNI